MRILPNGKLHPLYSRWRSMKARCKTLERYYRKGIKVQESWAQDYKLFRNYCYSICPNLDELLEQKYQIDRIDNDGNYEEGNIRFVTPKVNCNNQGKNNTRYLVNGQNLTVTEIIEAGYTNVPEKLFRNRLSIGWSIDKAMNTPVAKEGVFIEEKFYLWKEIYALNKLEIPHRTLTHRIFMGWSLEKSLYTPWKGEYARKSKELIKINNPFNLSARAIAIRLQRGWTDEEALFTPPGSKKRKTL